MKKFFGTLKRSTISNVLATVIVIVVILFALGSEYWFIHIRDGYQKERIAELQTDKEKLREEIKTKEKEWRVEKEKLEDENKELEKENAIARAQLNRVLWLVPMYQLKGVPVVGIPEELPLLGYYTDTEEETATINLKAGFSKVFLEFEFPEKTKKVLLTTPKGEKLDMVIRKNTIVIPLTKKGIYTLKISLKSGRIKYLAFDWMGKIKWER